MEHNNIICEEQNGFRASRSCEEHIFSLSSIIRNRLGQGQSTYAAFVDFQKAFDWVNRDILLNKLAKIGINGKMYQSIKNLYAETNAYVKINQHFTEPFDTTSGVRQGDAMSPTLFNIFINDLVYKINNINCGIAIPNGNNKSEISVLLYADDLILIAPSESKLQTMLNLLEVWCNKNRLVINMDKSQIMHFRTKKTQKTKHNFKIGNIPLKVVGDYKYLGILFTEHLDYSKTVELLANSGSRALGSIIHKISNLKECSFQTFSDLFNSGVNPILEYGSSVWGFKSSSRCQSVQNRAIRYHMGLNRFSANLVLQGDTGWTPINISIKLNMLRLWNRICMLPEHRVPYRILKWELNIGVNNWVKDIESILSSVSLFPQLENMEAIDISVIKSRLMAAEENAWTNAVCNKPKLRIYKLIKSNICTENYILCNNKKLRSIVAQFRCGTLPIEIETGRYKNIPRDQRLCKLCNTNVVEDEFHLIFDCIVYNDIRINLFYDISCINNIFLGMSQEEKLFELTNKHFKKFGNYLIDCLEIRKNRLYN